MSISLRPILGAEFITSGEGSCLAFFFATDGFNPPPFGCASDKEGNHNQGCNEEDNFVFGKVLNTGMLLNAIVR